MTDGTVYLLHGTSEHQDVRSEVGFTQRHVIIRLGEPLAGKGSQLTRAVHQADIDIWLARTFSGDLHTEYFLRHYEHFADLCSFCEEEKRHAIREG